MKCLLFYAVNIFVSPWEGEYNTGGFRINFIYGEGKGHLMGSLNKTL